MSAALIAVVLAVLLGHAMPGVARVRRFEWFEQWRRALRHRLHADLREDLGGLLLLLLPPVLALALLQSLLDQVMYGLPAFLLALLVLVWCWGPRDLDRDVDALLAADAGEATEASRRLSPTGAPLPTDSASLVDAVFRAALQRWFSVLLWFLLLGPAGALFYRLTQLAADRGDAESRPDSGIERLRTALEWPAAQLMTLALALAGSFDAVIGAWRSWHQARGGFPLLDNGYLGAAARASVVCELAEQAEDDDAPPPDVVAELPAAPALRDAMSLVWRVLVVWLTVLALFVLAGWAS